MDVVIFIDVNGQKSPQITPLLEFIGLATVSKIVLCGAPGPLSLWSAKLKKVIDSKLIETIPCSTRKDEGTIRLTKRVLQFANSGDAESLEDAHWLIVSTRSGFEYLAETLANDFGLSKARWVAAPTKDLFHSFIHDQNELGEVIRQSAEKIMLNGGSKPVLIGALANALLPLVSELKDADQREELFGSRRFKNILHSVGVKVNGQYAYPKKS